MIDPHDELPKITTSNNTILPEEMPVVDENLENLNAEDVNTWRNLSPVKKSQLFKIKLKKKGTKVSILQITEFLTEFISGTRTQHHMSFLARCPETLLMGEFSGDALNQS